MDGHKIVNQNGLHFLTMTVVGWVDVFTRQAYRDMLLESLKFCQQNKGLTINAYVIMSNHLHMIAYANEEYELSNIIRDFKKFIARSIIQDLIHNPKESRSEWMLQIFKHHGQCNNNNDKYQFWKRSNHPIELYNPSWIKQKLDYIHLNPVKGGWVENGHEYLYSSAGQYACKSEYLLEVEIIDFGMWNYVHRF